MPNSFILILFGFLHLNHSVYPQQSQKIDSLRVIILEHSTDSLPATEEEVIIVSEFLELSKDAGSKEDIILAYQQMAALNYSLGNANKALHYYRLYVLEQNQYTSNLKRKGFAFRENLAENEIKALTKKVEVLEEENAELKSSMAEFFEKNYLIFLGLKIILAICVYSLHWLDLRTYKKA